MQRTDSIVLDYECWYSDIEITDINMCLVETLTKALFT